MLQQVLSRNSKFGTTAEPASKPEESPQARYTAVIQGLLGDAYQQKSVVPLVNVLTWALAGIAHDFGSLAIADILGRFGGHLRSITEREAAQAEAEAAKRKGVQPQ
jgi:hypothetical protein